MGSPVACCVIALSCHSPGDPSRNDHCSASSCFCLVVGLRQENGLGFVGTSTLDTVGSERDESTRLLGTLGCS